MTCIITMAGRGSRFRDQGYGRPKYEIVAKEHTLFEWSLISLRSLIDKGAHFVFICLKENDSAEFLQKKCSELNLKSWSMVEISQVTDGQATTVLCSEEHLKDGNSPVLIYNIDTHVDPNAMEIALGASEIVVPCFEAEGDHWSFVKVNEAGIAVETSEKVRISNRASLGLYTFSSFAQFKGAYQQTYLDPMGARPPLKEKYIAPMYNALIREKRMIRAPLIDPRFIAPLGTPEEVKRFQSSHSRWPS